MEYTVDYFINKFEAIPEHQWTTEMQLDYMGRSCALGHCIPEKERVDPACFGNRYTCAGHLTNEGSALHELLFNETAVINNGQHPGYQQPTPKQRILAALQDIKAKEQPVKEVVRYITVDSNVRELQKEKLCVN